MPKRRGKGEGSIEQLPSGSYRAIIWIRVPETGKLKRHRFTHPKKSKALAWLREKQAEANAGTFADHHGKTLKQWANEWLEIRRTKTEPKTHVTHEQLVRLHIVPRIGDLVLDQITPLAVEQWYARMTAEAVTPTRQRKASKTLRALLEAARRHRLISANPVDTSGQPKARLKEIAPLSADQVRKLLEVSVGHRHQALLMLAIDAGMRPGELFGLHWPEVDLTSGIISVRQTLEQVGVTYRLKQPKTAKGKRRIRITPETVAALTEHRAKMTEEGRDTDAGPVFVNAAGNWISQPNFANRTMQQMAVKIGMKTRLRTYDLRHTCATLLLAAGVNLRVVADRLGHESVEMTLRHYAHTLPAMEEQAVGMMSLIFSSSHD